MLRLLLGVLKGGVIGGALGYGLEQAGLGWLAVDQGWLVYGVVGFLVGFFVGRPFWSHLADKKSTVWTSILKGAVGFGFGAGVWALVAKVAGNPSAFGMPPLTHALPVFAGAVGVIYGAWVEFDDPPVKKTADQPPAPGK
jgi:hypothetical protein